MNTYRVTAPDGRTLKITGDTMPTEQELDEIFEATGTNQSVLDNRDGKIYNVPMAMDGIDTEFAIDTQHKGADKGSFFGKINVVGQRLEQGWNELTAGVLEHVGAASDAFLSNAYNEQEKIARLQEAKKGDFSSWNREFTEEEKAEKIKYLEENTKWINALREKNKKFWDKGIEILSPEEKQDKLTPFLRGLGGATASTVETGLSALTTKNPMVASALVGYLYGKIKETEYFDKAIESGTNARSAQRDADIAGIIEGGIELIGDKLLIGIGKVPQIQQISNRVVSSAMVKAFKDKVGKEAVKKIASKHLESVAGASIKGFGSEFSEEALQSYLGDVWENITAVSDKSGADMVRDALFSGFIGGISGAGFGVAGTSTYNREIKKTNAKIKNALKQYEPNLTEEELQTTADFLQEALYQEGNSYMKELNTVLEKETLPDVNPEGLDAKAITEQTRKNLKENYGMTDEEIEKTINISLGMIDARNQFNEIYTHYRNELESAGYKPIAADSGARMIAARALSIIRDEKITAKDAIERLNLKFKRMKFADFKKMEAGQLGNPQYSLELDDFIPFQTVLAKKTDVSTNVDPKQIRKDAKKYLLDKVRKQDITHPKLGKIRVSRKGIDEFINTSGNIDKLALVPHLKELIETSRVGEKEDLTHPREDNIVAFYPLYNDAVIDGRIYDVTTKIGVDREGNLFYTVLIDENNSSESGGVGNKSTVANEAINVSITPSAQNVNKIQYQESLNIAQENAELDKVNPAYEGETININGVECTVYNSNGDRIAMSEPALRNFYNWFGDSNVVDEQGRPLVVYHGTKAEFDTFNKNMVSNYSAYSKNFYFTKNKQRATDYGNKILSAYLKSDNLFDVELNLPTRADIEKINIILAKDGLKLEGDYGFDGMYMTGENFLNDLGVMTEQDYDYLLKEIGYDGIKSKDEFIVFEPNQIKSISNRGTYSESDNIYMQDSTNAPRGAYRNNIIYLFENADASTLIHELGHFFLDDMQKFATSEESKKQLQAVYDYLGSKDGKLTREMHELFADTFELYVYEGKAPNSLLGKVFERFKHWLFKLKQEISRLGYVKINDDIRKVFDEMLGGRGIDFAMQMSGVRLHEALESGTISHHVIDRAIKLLEEGKMSKSDMDDLISRMKMGELKRKEFAQELKTFENGNVKHNEQLNPFDTMKYRSILSKGNFSKKDVVEKINRLLKWSKPRSQNGKLVGRFADINLNRELDHIRELMAMDKDQAKRKMDENVEIITNITKGIAAGDADRLAFDNKILSIALGKSSAEVVLEVYNAISDSYNIGRLTTSITGEAKRKRRQRLVDEAVEVLTGDGTVNWRQEKGKAKKFINQLGISQMSWQGILDILSMNDKTSKTGKSKLVKNLDVFEAEQKEARGVADDGEKVSKFIEAKLKGVGNSQIAVSRYVNSKLTEKFTIEWGKNKKTFTKDQLLDIYMKSKGPETRQIMAEDDILQYNDDFLNEVNLILTAEDRAVAEALFDFYDNNHAKINEFYEDKYGISLPKRDFYSPRSMERGGVNVDTGDLASFAGFSNVKERKAKAGTIKVKGAFQVLQDYIVNSNHWIAWSDKLIDINAVMGDVKVKEIISNLFGDNVVNRIGYEVSRMASNDKFQSKFGWGNFFNKVRSNYAVSVLGVKPSLAIKQLTSFPAYLEYISPKEFMEGLADFAVNMKEAIETLGNTTLMKTRDVNIIKDFAELSKLEMFKKGTTKVKLREFMMANIKLGDRGAIYMGGWALYKAELKKNLAKKMKPEEAKAKAIEVFERVTDETQQSGRLSQQSYWQSNPFLRAFTMFQSSQNQYLRKEINAVRGLATGRMDKKQVAKVLFIYHVLLPCLFQYASDGFEWDWKAQLRAGLLGSLNGIFILNEILERGLDIALGTADAWRATRMGIRDVLPFWGSIEDIYKFFVDLAEGDIDLEDFMEVIRAFGKPLGELTGVPVKYPLDVIQNFGNYAEEEEYGKEVLLWLGWSPYALRDKNEE